MKPTPFLKALEICKQQYRTLEKPCLDLGCCVRELEQRLNRLEPEALETVASWLVVRPETLAAAAEQPDK